MAQETLHISTEWDVGLTISVNLFDVIILYSVSLITSVGNLRMGELGQYIHVLQNWRFSSSQEHLFSSTD